MNGAVRPLKMRFSQGQTTFERFDLFASERAPRPSLRHRGQGRVALLVIDQRLPLQLALPLSGHMVFFTTPDCRTAICRYNVGKAYPCRASSITKCAEHYALELRLGHESESEGSEAVLRAYSRRAGNEQN